MADPSDLPVFTGYEERKPGPGEWTTQEEAKFLYGGVPTGYTRRQLITKPQSVLEKDFYALDPDDLAILQKRLYAAGLFSQGVDPDEVILGVHDEQTFSAYQRAVTRAARFHQAGQEFTVDDVIDQAAGLWEERGGPGGKGAGGRGMGSTRRPLSVQLTNPEDLSAIAQRTAVATLGRALRTDELNRFVSSFHASQRAEQTASYGAAEGGGTVTTAPSPTTAAAGFARREAPTEAGGNDFLRVYDAFSRILARRG